MCTESVEKNNIGAENVYGKRWKNVIYVLKLCTESFEKM